MVRAPVDSTSPFDGRIKSIIRFIIMETSRLFGVRIEKLEDTRYFWRDESSLMPDLQMHLRSTPGMISLRRGMYLYWLAFASGSGDIIEIGSWQGRSTIALAQACSDAKNGKVHAIDNFEGNSGTEKQYVINSEDLSDLKENFLLNIDRAGLSKFVKLYSMSSSEAADIVSKTVDSIRMIYIDGEHTYDAVKQDLDCYAPLLSKGGIIAFDDYSPRFDGVKRAIDEHLAANKDTYCRPVQDSNLLVLKKV